MFLGYDLEVIQPLLQRLVDEGLALVVGQGGAAVYRRNRSEEAP
ncbi:MAG: hypothetical protein NTY36_02600 [Deltaproteobacteria bacterium]|nr:hypothetical protein [Deltaproteobacteria bacterium]